MKASLLLKQTTGTLVFFAVIFLSAGSLLYWQGLVYLAIGVIMFILSCSVFRLDPGLMEERSRPGAGTKRWDKIILGLSFLGTISMYVLAGLDSGRFHWSPSFHMSLFITGIILTIAGQLIFLVAQKQNRFFSSTVRIQTERGHTVCESGLYSIVRHPAYAGSLLQLIGFPLLFGSLWSIIPVLISIIILVTRTYLEDKTLMNELQGYPEYSGKTRYRLILYIW